MRDEILQTLAVTQLHGVVQIQVREGSRKYRSNRESSAFAVKKSGKTIYQQNGVKTVSDASHVVFLPKGATYSLDVVKEGECILFEVEFADSVPYAEITAIPVIQPETIFLLAEKASYYWIYKKPGFRLKGLACLYDILSYGNIAEDAYIDRKKITMLAPAIHYLEDNLQDPEINTEKLSMIAGLSIPYFRKIFHEIYKMPVAKYIESIRIGKAKDLLGSDYSSVGDVAEAVGYREIYHFSKVFKKVTGITPSEFARLRFRKE